jgi:hypothetical protein
MMICTETNRGSNRRHDSGGIAALLGVVFLTMFGALLLAGCSITDTPQASLAPEQDVRNYYILVDSQGLHYDYAVTSNGSSLPASVSLGMDMQGVSDTLNTMPLYACLWTYQNYGTPITWYYGLTQKQAINYSFETAPGVYWDSWVDLQAPLDDTAHWTFESQGEQISAKVLQYGATAQVNGKSYNNVLMVQYTGVAGTTGTEWFAKGSGLIFSNITRPGSGTVESQLKDIIQK